MDGEPIIFALKEMEATDLSKECVDMSIPVIEMRDIVKKFGDFVANNGINLTVHKGEIHAILGENGAGKSTLMKVLTGIYTKDSGTILYEGKEVEYHSAREAQEAGIVIV